MPRHDVRMSQSQRVRRSSAEVRSLVLGAARELFEDRGYDNVSTRDIAARAGVTQALVFRHFGTKAELFVEAVYLPFSQFVAVYLNRWVDRRPDDQQASLNDTEVFVDGLYRILLENRKLLITLSSVAGRGSPDVPVRASTLLSGLLGNLEREVVRTIEARGAAAMNPAYSVRFTFALVYGSALLDEALFPDTGDEAARAAISEAMAGFVLRGAELPG